MAMVVVSARVAEEVRAAVAERAAAEGVTVSTLAGRMLSEALVRPARSVEDGPLVSAVRELYEGLSGPGVPVEREAALQLARVAESGGAAGVAATRELLALAERSLTDMAKSDDLISQLRARREQRRAADREGRGSA